MRFRQYTAYSEKKRNYVFSANTWSKQGCGAETIFFRSGSDFQKVSAPALAPAPAPALAPAPAPEPAPAPT